MLSLQFENRPVNRSYKYAHFKKPLASLFPNFTSNGSFETKRETGRTTHTNLHAN